MDKIEKTFSLSMNTLRMHLSKRLNSKDALVRIPSYLSVLETQEQFDNPLSKSCPFTVALSADKFYF